MVKNERDKREDSEPLYLSVPLTILETNLRELPSRVASSPTRDDSDYWRTRPSDHAPDGLFIYGPHDGRPSWPRLIVSRPSPVDTPSPIVARGHTAMRGVHAKRREVRRVSLLRALGLAS